MILVCRYRGKKSLGWVPFKRRAFKREGNAFPCAGNTFRVFQSRALPEEKIKGGSNSVGNVNAARLARTCMAKSVLNAGRSSFRTQLACKAVKHGAGFEEVNETLRPQVCSNCGALPDSRPRGIADLGTRNWMCSDCGCAHDRDVNAAKNILNKFASRAGHGTPAVGIPVLWGGADVNTRLHKTSWLCAGRGQRRRS